MRYALIIRKNPYCIFNCKYYDNALFKAIKIDMECLKKKKPKYLFLILLYNIYHEL